VKKSLQYRYDELATPPDILLPVEQLRYYWRRGPWTMDIGKYQNYAPFKKKRIDECLDGMLKNIRENLNLMKVSL
jgi:hypothetical protein